MTNKKAKGGVHKVEQDRAEGTVYSGPDFGAEVDENLYKVRKKEESIREQRSKFRQTR